MCKYLINIRNRAIFILALAAIWEIAFRLSVFPMLLFPSVEAILKSLVHGFSHGQFLSKTFNTLTFVFEGLLLGFAIAVLLFAVSMVKKWNGLCKNIVDSMVLFFNPIPSMAILPLCILWFGIGKTAMLFIMVHSIIWGVLTNITMGRDSIPVIYKDVGRNLELSSFRVLKDIYLPACSPYIISGARVALARAWRTAISAEIVVGISNHYGLGRQMTLQRNKLDTPGLLASIIVIIAVAMILDMLFFFIEDNTIKKWGIKE
ncbi:ABC transporter permease [Spirochaetia bacterium]|nr:ABC transporter permease [Spirochaetia bacterium]